MAKVLDENVTDFNVTATLGDVCCDRPTSLETEFLIRRHTTGVTELPFTLREADLGTCVVGDYKPRFSRALILLLLCFPAVPA